MAVNIITQEDLQKFKFELFAELKNLLPQISGSPSKKWLKSYEVRQMLGISRGTLQNLYNTGVLPGNRVGGLTFYDYDDIQKLMQSNKKVSKRA
ncbi:MAG: helix-turn-helix domain-containing protein [Bacteroidetes bacterium]|nr:helix-turn-helix domain-containing protein [Bacteroidota bacterium]